MSVLSIDINVLRQAFKLQAKLSLLADDHAVLIGPSGSGKTTLLRAIAGLEKPQCGVVKYKNEYWFDCARKINLKPQKRQVGFVFQDYALFEHMTVAENVGYSITGKYKAREIRKWLSKVHLTDVANTSPSQLSGGQRQRVAIARVLAQRPRVLLLDEPFSALDIGLRKSLQRELINLLNEIECPALIVTHDLNEARYIANKIGVINQGKLLCFDAAASLFANPRSVEVAHALGWRNFLPIEWHSGHRVSGQWGSMRLNRCLDQRASHLAIRPEHIRISQSGQQGFRAVVDTIHDMGPIRIVELRLNECIPFVMHVPWDTPVPAPGCSMHIRLPEQHLYDLYHEETKHKIRAITRFNNDSAKETVVKEALLQSS